MRTLALTLIALALAACASRDPDAAYWGRVATTYKDITNDR